MSDAAPYSIIVDERDARITYTGNWTPGGSSFDFQRTSYASNDTSATMIFRFNGTSIMLLGDIEPGGSCSGTFSVDGSSTSYTSPAVDTPQYQQRLFSLDGLNEGEHTFVYDVGACEQRNASTSGPYVWVDHLLYTAANPALDGLMFFVDDRDPSLDYSGSWEQMSWDGSFLQTVSGGASGSSVKYSFTGTSISVYGASEAGGGLLEVTFSLDGDSEKSTSSPLPQNSTNVKLFSSERLELGQHTLEILPLSQDPIWLDYIVVNAGSAPLTATPSTQGSGVNIPAIIAGSAGGAVTLIAALIVLWFVLKRRKTRNVKRYSGASSAKYFGRKNEGLATGIYAPSTTAASHWSTKNAGSVTSTTSGHLGEVRTTSRNSRIPALPATRPVLYDPIDNSTQSPGFSSAGSRGEEHHDVGDGAYLLSQSQNNGVYPPTPPYTMSTFDVHRPESPGSRTTGGMYATQPSSPSHTVTTFDRSADHSDISLPSRELVRSPTYRTHASGAVSSRATSPTDSHGHQPLASISETDARRQRRASITPSYITTVPLSNTLEISDFLPPRVVAARQEALGSAGLQSSETRAPPSSFNQRRIPPTNTHERAPSYATTASSYPPTQSTRVSAQAPPVPPIPLSSKAPNIPHSPPPLPTQPPPQPPSNRLGGPRARQPLPRPPSVSGESATSGIRGESAPSTISEAPSVHTTATHVTATTTASGMSAVAEMKRREAMQEAQAAAEQHGNSGDRPNGRDGDEPPPQYTYRF